MNDDDDNNNECNEELLISVFVRLCYHQGAPFMYRNLLVTLLHSYYTLWYHKP